MDEQLTRTKLGLALAGGGFRASLFHLGVFHRLAELDLLRRVEVLSTVSGGSIIGALYVLLLKERLEQKPALEREDYIELVAELDRILISGISKDLRTRLLLNPFGVLRIMVSGDSLGNRMARLYERYLYQSTVAKLRRRMPVPWYWRWLRPGALPLRDLRIRPEDHAMQSGIDAYNRSKTQFSTSAVTSIVLNATSLNSGGRFFMSSVELGDWYLGYVRFDEIKALLARKRLLQELPIVKLEDALNKPSLAELKIKTEDEPLLVSSLAYWLRERKTDQPKGWESIFALPGFPGDLLETELGLLRRAKLSAWYILKGYHCKPRITGGLSIEQHRDRFRAALKDIDSKLYEAVSTLAADDERWPLLLRFVIELYLMRSAQRVSKNIKRDWARLTVADGVGASACFPPVFPPFMLMGIYDDQHVARLGLSDGGVYDNTGIRALLDEGCNCIIASDTGGPFKEERYSPPGHLQMLPRIPNILMRAVGELQRIDVKERRRFAKDVTEIEAKLPETATAARSALDAVAAARGVSDLAYFHIASPAPAPEGALEFKVDGRNLAQLRTDLDGFGEIEIAGLVNHGYNMADRYVREYMRGWTYSPPKAPKPVIDQKVKHVDTVLRAGRARFLRGLQTRATITMVVVLAAVAAFVVAAWRGLTAQGLLRAFGSLWTWSAGQIGAVVRAVLPSALEGPVLAVPRVLPDVVVPWLRERWSDPRALIGLIGLLVAVKLIRRSAHALAPRIRKHGIRLTWPQTTWKWLVNLRGNLFWLAWALPLVVAAIVSVFAVVGYLLFYLPWQRSARVRPADIAQAKPATEPVLQPR